MCSSTAGHQTGRARPDWRMRREHHFARDSRNRCVKREAPHPPFAYESLPALQTHYGPCRDAARPEIPRAFSVRNPPTPSSTWRMRIRRSSYSREVSSSSSAFPPHRNREAADPAAPRPPARPSPECGCCAFQSPPRPAAVLANRHRHLIDVSSNILRAAIRRHRVFAGNSPGHRTSQSPPAEYPDPTRLM